MIKTHRRRSKAATVRDNRKSAVIYARVSSTEQEKDGFSIPAQLRLLREYAERHAINVSREFIDVETAKQAGRTCFNEMLELLVTTPGLRTILVEKTDRLYRNFRDYVTIDDLDLEIHLVKENEIISGDSRSHQKFIHGIKVLMAKNYIDNLSEETKKGMAEKVASGGFPHRAPMGYRNDSNVRTIVIDSDKAPYVRRLFEWYASGEFSLEDLHDRCVADGLIFPGRKGVVAKSKIEYLLKNPFYVGLVRWAGRLYPGAHEPLISQQLFDRVQDQFLSHGRRRGKYRIHSFAYGALLTCGLCGYALTGMRVKKRYVYYKCMNHAKTCTEGYYREEDLAPQFAEIVRRVSLAPVVVDWVKNALRSSLEDETAFHDAALVRLTEELEKVKRRMNQAYLDKVDGKIDEDFWAECSANWQAEKSRILERLGRHEQADDRYIDEGARLLDLAQRVTELFGRQDPGERQRLLVTILERCTIQNGVLTPKYRPPWDVIANMSAEKEPPPANLILGRRRSSRIVSWGG